MRNIYLLILFLTGTACGNQTGEPDLDVYVHIDVSQLDSSFVPADDFFEFVNNRWIANNPIPPSKSSWGVFHELREESRLCVKEILEDAGNGRDDTTESGRLLGKWWRSAMDTLRIEQEGINSLTALRRRWMYGNDAETRARHYALAMASGICLPFAVYVDQDLKNNNRHALYIIQNGLGLPEQAYYFRTDPRSREIRRKYQVFVQQMLMAGGYGEKKARIAAGHIMEIETAMARVSMPVEDLRSPDHTYNPVAVNDLENDSPAFNWKTFFKECGINPDTVIVGQPEFIRGWARMLGKFGEDKWEAYYYFHELRNAAPFLHQELFNLHFDFYGKTLAGKVEPEPRWQYVATHADYLLRDLVGQEYVKRKFDGKSKELALELVENLRAAFDRRLQHLDWMSETTQKEAREKLRQVVVKIGYPDRWKTYEGLQLSQDSYLQNVAEAEAYSFRRMLSKLNEPVDRTEWYMGPQTVNAYYNPPMNEIVFPAAILQPPFFHPDADAAVNYGGIGMVIGHELTHGFDDQGRKFDAEGNFRNWWAPEDEEKFNMLAHRFVTFYQKFRPVDTIPVNGELTLGENIADLGGLLIAWDAFQALPEKERSQNIDGLSPEERFFISFAQIWRAHQREETLIQRLYTDVHAPGKYRVTGVLSNFPAFYQTFGVKPGNKMFVPEEEQCKLW